MSTTEQIEARALELHQARKANTARRSQAIADLMTFDGGERDFCLRVARSQIDEEEYQAELEAARVANMAVLSDLQIENIIAEIDAEYGETFYRPGIHTGRMSELRLERDRYVKEQFRRSVTAPVMQAAE